MTERSSDARISAGGRIDQSTLVREEATFFGDRPDRLFGVLSEPATPPLGGVVIASPVYEEMVKNYRREVMLARSLAARGVAVQRFHYRGTGHSDGDGRDLTFASMLEDLEVAAEHLRSRTGTARIVILGTRLGGLLALGGNVERGPLVLWDPVIEPSAYFRELSRLRGMQSVVGPGRRPPAIADELEERESVDILGYEVTRRMIASCEGHTAASAPCPEAVLLVQLRQQSTLGSDYRRLVHRWHQAEVRTEILVEMNPLPWWFEINDPSSPLTWLDTPPFLAVTRDWVVGTLDGGGSTHA